MTRACRLKLPCSVKNCPNKATAPRGWCPAHWTRWRLSGDVRADVPLKTGARRLTHGESKPETAEYRAWHKMKDRVQNPNHIHWKYYGGRGIKICERWSNSYESFLADMGRKPSPSHSLERINNNGDYEPENCKWATAFEQRNNIRKNIRVSHLGRIQTISQWAREFGLTHGVLSRRLKLNWPMETAVTTPVRTRIKADYPAPPNG